jgi:hypothetical protein
MERNQLFSMALAAATLGLTACGGSDGVATTPGTGGGHDNRCGDSCYCSLRST